MNKILLLGDSIRLSYQQLVKEKLEGVAEVVGPEDNCRFAKYTLWNTGEWVTAFGKPDIIHWNNGIWDVFFLNKEMGIFTPIDEYKIYIGRVLKELRRTGAKIIWATTTPVREGAPCKNSDIDLYNAEANKIMRSENIDINDLNKVIKEKDEYIAADNFHLSPEGIIVCAQACVDFLKKII